MAVYNVPNTVTVSSFDSTVTIPTYTCVHRDGLAVYENTDDGANGYSGPSVQLDCSSKNKPTLASLLTIDNSTVTADITIHEGDKVEFSVTCGSSGTTESIDDLTSGKTATDSSASASSCANSFVGDIGLSNAKGNIVPLPTFKTIKFSNVTVNSEPLATYSPTSTNYYEGSTQRIAVSALNAAGTGFTTKKVS